MKKNDLFTQVLLGLALFATIWFFMNKFGPSPEDLSKKSAKQNSSQQGQGRSTSRSSDSSATISNSSDNSSTTGTSGNKTAPAAGSSEVTAVPHENIEVKTDEFTAVFTTLGAGMKSYTFNKYFNYPEDEGAHQRIKLPLAVEMSPGVLSLSLEEANIGRLRNRIAGRHWNLVSVPAGVKAPEGVKAEGELLVFTTVLNGVKLTRTYDFSKENIGNGFGFRNYLSFENTSSQDLVVDYVLNGPAGIFPDNTDTRFGALTGISGYLAGKSEPSKDRTALSDLKGKTHFEHDNEQTVWLGLNNRFFASILVNKQPDDMMLADFQELKYSRELSREIEGGQVWAKQMLELHPYNAVASYKSRSIKLRSGAKFEHLFEFYGGPLSDEIAGNFNPYLDNVVTYSWDFLGPVSRFLLTILRYLESVVHNYGIAIICLTILVKLCLHPLTRKSMRSQHKMQLVQPLLKEIKEKYKNDRQKQQQETMRIFKENGVNPVGGCLPMLLQLPIFFSLYGTFAYSFAMRQKPFIAGWINDLSLPDNTMQLPFTIPLLGSDYLNLLPIIYLALQIVHMGMMPKSADPQMQSQQKMMKFMPVIFMFFFYSMPSGLVLYFTTQSLLTLVEHYFIKKNIKSEPVPGAQVATVDGKVPAGTGFGGKKNGKK